MKFWNSVKTYLTSKGILRNDDIAFSFENQTLTYNRALAKLFNEYGFDSDRLVVDKIIKTYKNHASIKSVKSNVPSKDI